MPRNDSRVWSPAFNEAYWRGINETIKLMGRNLNVKEIAKYLPVRVMGAIFNVSDAAVARDVQDEILRQERRVVPTEVAQRIYRPDE